MGGSERDIHRRAKKGIRLLLVRQGFLQVFTFLGGVVLARVLSPADFGVFGITTFLVGVLALFADFGMSPALIQRKRELSERDLQVGFTMQQALVLVVVVFVWLAAPWMAGFYPAHAMELEWLVRAMALNLYLGTWRSISAISLERELRYEKLALIEVVESLSYQITAVVLAVMGFEVWSLVAAVLVRSLLGTVLIFRVAPWKVRFVYDPHTTLELLRFGIPFQVHRIVGNVRNWVTPTLVASLIGADAVGFLMWASSNGRKPRNIIQNVVRVSLPHFSRIQDRSEEVTQILRQYVLYFFVLCGGWLALLASMGYPLVEVIYTAKWLPAVPALILYAGLLNLNSVSWIIKTALSGTGRVKYVMYVTMMTTVLSVSLSVGLVLEVGFIGVPVAEVVSMVLTVPVLAYGLLGKRWPSLFTSSLWVLGPLLASVAAGMGVRLLPIPQVAEALLGTVVVVGVYGGMTWLLAPSWLQRRLQGQWVNLKQRLLGRNRSGKDNNVVREKEQSTVAGP
ncbi:MAG: hypothetical protein KatS3mg044_0697 [Rhodothermaceae bacterium]|nr:MAG: hypothetical protein KatS3mg044_0697 [Rhodothermaceae bacterium]